MSIDGHATNITLSGTQSDITYELSEIVTKVALQNFEWRYITFVYFNSTLWSAVEVFLRSYEKAVVIGRGTFYPKFARKTRQYILFGTSITTIVPTLEWMRNHEFDNTGKYIIVCQSLDLQDCDEAHATRIFWKYKITNVIYFKSFGNSITGFTYYPLNDSNCNYDVPVPIKNLRTCLDAINFQEACDFFPLKLENLNSCPLVASTFVQPPYMKIENGKPSGSDGDLLCLIAEKLDGNLTVMTPFIGSGWGKLEENGSWSGSLGDIYYDYANFSMTSGAITFARFSYFQLSTHYNAANVVWITHPAKKIPSSLKLLYPFQTNAQIALAISFVAVVVCSLIIRSRFWLKISRKIKMEIPRSSVVFYSWMICMGLPTTKLPTKSAFMYIVYFWMWYCVLMRTFYQVSLITALKANYYFEEFDSIDDAIDAEYPFGGGAALRDYYIDYPRVYNKWTDVNTKDIIPTLRKMSLGSEFVLATNMETAKTIIWKEKIHLHIIPQKVVSSPNVLFFKKFSPLADSVNKVLVKLTESGFSDKLYKNYAIKQVADTEETPEPIKLEHYAGCYGILITGWIISFLIFVAEILFEKIYNRSGAIQ